MTRDGVVPAFDLKVQDVFPFGDGTTVLVGEMAGDPLGLVAPCMAEVWLDGVLMGAIRIAGSRMPGPGTPKGWQAIYTHDPLPVGKEKIAAGTCEVVHRP